MDGEKANVKPSMFFVGYKSLMELHEARGYQRVFAVLKKAM